MMKRKRHRITHTHSWSRLPEDDTETPDTAGLTGKYRQTVGVCINEGGGVRWENASLFTEGQRTRRPQRPRPCVQAVNM